MLNLNVPAGATQAVWTKLGKRFYEDDVHERIDPRGGKYLWIGGGLAGIAEIPGTDCHAVIREGMASITPLGLDATCHELVDGERPDWDMGVPQTG